MDIKNITIKGFQINTNADKVMVINISCAELINHIWDHNTMKNITKKKSLRVLILADISNLIGEKDRLIQATNAHISIENQK